MYYVFKEDVDIGNCLLFVFPSHSDEPSCVLHSYWNFLNSQYKEGTCMQMRKDAESRTLACNDASCSS